MFGFGIQGFRGFSILGLACRVGITGDRVLGYRVWGLYARGDRGIGEVRV